MRVLKSFCLVFGLFAASGCANVPTPLMAQHHGSIGSASYGVLLDPVLLPKSGPGYKRFRPFGTQNYGSFALVSMLQDAAAASLTTPDAPPLVIGDLAAKTGGEIEGHKSHRTGRDVDLLFFYTTPAGVPVEAPDFIKVQTDGIAYARQSKASSPYYVLDIPRNWTLVKSLLRNKYAPIQWLFVARQVESLLIEYARARDEDPMLVWQAENIMHEPADSMPHDDHFHMRVACTNEELTQGCIQNGPQWPWLNAAETISEDEAIKLVLQDL